MGHHKRNSGGGNSHDRRAHRKHNGDSPPQPTPDVKEQKREFVSLKQRKQVEAESRQRLQDFLGLGGFAVALASWSWTVIVPESSAIFGSVLLLVSVVCTFFALRSVWRLGRISLVLAAIVLAVGFVAFDWYIVIKPQRGKPFQALLVEGYHIENECATVPGKTPMPTWMRDQSKEWQARVQQLISDKLNVEESQTWRNATIIGLVKDENLNAYQCLWMANKVAALETIIAAEYDPKLKHRNYNGPTYWFDAANGKVDISDAFKNGNRQADVYVNGGDDGNGDKASEPPQTKPATGAK